MASKFQLQKASLQDVEDMACVFGEAFTREPKPQALFYARMFPETSGVRDFFSNSFAQQMQREPNSVFLKIVERVTNRMAGFVKWTAPDTAESFWAPYSPDMDGSMCDAFFGAMAENRAALMSDRKHWFLELMGVSASYHRQGAGYMMVSYGCQLADKDGVEAYVDASPAAAPLYEKCGFVSKNQAQMPPPFDWYIERFMVRPAKLETEANI